jgi:hypothetical protein
MLSRQLISVFKTLRPYTETGVHIAPEKVFTICAVLQDAIDEAEALEAKLAPHLGDDPNADLPKNVTRLTPRDGGKVACFSPRPSTSGPEDAA